MDLGLITLRVLHIVSGVFWVGGVFFFTLLLEPRLRALGPTIQRPVMQSITPVMGPAFEIASVIAMVTGIAMVFVLRSGDLSSIFDTRWGWAILMGFISTLIAAVIGFGFAQTTVRRMQGVAAGIEGRPSQPERDAAAAKPILAAHSSGPDGLRISADYPSGDVLRPLRVSLEGISPGISPGRRHAHERGAQSKGL